MKLKIFISILLNTLFYFFSCPAIVNYYQVLPATTTKSPTLSFIPSRLKTSMSLDEAFIKMLAEAFAVENFVETGTYQGETTIRAACYFPTVHSIELSKTLFQQAQQRLKGYNNIHLHQGDSITVLASLISQLSGRTLFFLDAHYSMGNTARGSENTVIMQELELIKKHNLTDAILVIDDIRMFYEPLTDISSTFMQGYPTLEEILQKVLEINRTYCCALIFDTLIFYPTSLSITVSPTVRAATISRLYNEKNFKEEEILVAELQVAHAPDKEQAALKTLAETCMESFGRAAGLSRHYALWYGLTCLARQDYKNAHAYLEEASVRGLTHWRIEWYKEMAKAECFFNYR